MKEELEKKINKDLMVRELISELVSLLEVNEIGYIKLTKVDFKKEAHNWDIFSDKELDKKTLNTIIDLIVKLSMHIEHLIFSIVYKEDTNEYVFNIGSIKKMHFSIPCNNDVLKREGGL